MKILSRLKTITSGYPDGYKGSGFFDNPDEGSDGNYPCVGWFSFNLIFNSEKYPKLAEVYLDYGDNGLEEPYKDYDFCAFLTFCAFTEDSDSLRTLKDCSCALSPDEDGFDEKGKAIDDISDTLPSSAFGKIIEKANKTFSGISGDPRDPDSYWIKFPHYKIEFNVSKLDKTPKECYPWNKNLNKVPCIFLD